MIHSLSCNHAYLQIAYSSNKRYVSFHQLRLRGTRDAATVATRYTGAQLIADNTVCYVIYPLPVSSCIIKYSWRGGMCVSGWCAVTKHSISFIHCRPSRAIHAVVVLCGPTDTSSSASYVVITITIPLRSDYDVSRVSASSSTQAKNEHVNFSS